MGGSSSSLLWGAWPLGVRAGPQEVRVRDVASPSGVQKALGATRPCRAARRRRCFSYGDIPNSDLLRPLMRSSFGDERPRSEAASVVRPARRFGSGVPLRPLMRSSFGDDRARSEAASVVRPARRFGSANALIFRRRKTPLRGGERCSARPQVCLGECAHLSATTDPAPKRRALFGPPAGLSRRMRSSFGDERPRSEAASVVRPAAGLSRRMRSSFGDDRARSEAASVVRPARRFVSANALIFRRRKTPLRSGERCSPRRRFVSANALIFRRQMTRRFGSGSPFTRRRAH
ncbi:hypothetical protein ENSA5_57730 [Enhygromyxa salina]|uniref:Uncharacterized protein n=1 Tax=Enhygromyxa salina TaxID=215803 RepID=A0A2S9XE66_9BACT|nr:hypothetical protein ENSA5_57730 [Enhygromyxa salina]